MNKHCDDAEICRTCLSRKELKPIFKECASNNVTTTIAEMVKACATVQIYDGDGLPSSMCSNCIEDVQRAYCFKVKCEKADEILRSVDTLLFKDLLPLTVKFETDCVTGNEIKHETAEQTRTSENLTTKSVTNDEHFNVESIFRCTRCLSLFKSRSVFDCHVKKNCTSYKCALCERTFSSKRFLQRHENSHSAKTRSVKHKKSIEHKEIATDEDTGHGTKENDTKFAFKNENDSVNNYSEIKEEIDDETSKDASGGDSVKGEARLNGDDETKIATRKVSCRKGSISKQYLCTICNSIFFNKVQLKVHLEKHSENECKPCKRQFSNVEELCEHLVSEHRLHSGHRCVLCSKSFKRSSHLKQHITVHTGDKPFVCDICSKQFSNSANLHRHRMIHTGERPHRCHVCNKAFIQGPSLAEHIRRHTGETPYLCTVCGMSFHSTSLLKVHTAKKHDSDRADKDGGENERRASNRARRRKATNSEQCAYVCSVCNRGYVTKGGLSVHLLTHDGKRFLCSECGKSFSTKMGLDLHVNGHAGVKPFSCKACGKSFANSSALKHHTFTHTGEKPYECVACGKTFSQGAHLRSHMRTHSGERPYVCSLCGKNFTQSGNMKQHMRVHTGEKLYPCPVCEKRFNGSNNMRKHLKSHNKQKQQT